MNTGSDSLNSDQNVGSFNLIQGNKDPIYLGCNEIDPQNQQPGTHTIGRRDQRSGPKTLDGKRRSARNSTRHGLYSSSTVVAKLESKGGYERFARALLADFNLRTPLELALAERVCSALWRLRRVRRYETECLDEKANHAFVLCSKVEAESEKADVLLRAACTIREVANGSDLKVKESYDIEIAILSMLDDRCMPHGDAKKSFATMRRKGDPIPNGLASWLIAKIVWPSDDTRDSRMRSHNLLVFSKILHWMANGATKGGPINGLSVANILSEALVLNTEQAARVNDIETRLDRQLSRAISDLLAIRPDAMQKLRSIAT